MFFSGKKQCGIFLTCIHFHIIIKCLPYSEAPIKPFWKKEAFSRRNRLEGQTGKRNHDKLRVRQTVVLLHERSGGERVREPHKKLWELIKSHYLHLSRKQKQTSPWQMQKQKLLLLKVKRLLFHNGGSLLV